MTGRTIPMSEAVATIHPLVNEEFTKFVDEEVLPLTTLERSKFWSDFSQLVDDLAPRNRELRKIRLHLQDQIDNWHRNNSGAKFDEKAYLSFLQTIGYILEEGEDFQIQTENVDDEIAKLAGPQLVVPLKNARFVLNAVNARWGSLYDALYGTDVIPTEGELNRGIEYNQKRGNKVIDYARRFLDEIAPLSRGSHHDVAVYRIYFQQLLAILKDGTCTGLKQPSKFVAFDGDREAPTTVLLKNNGLHVEIQIDRQAMVGSTDLAGINDILIEAAITTIVDCEDSIAAVDTEDKIEVYRNWLGLMQGNLVETFVKNDEIVTRKLNSDREYIAADGSSYRVAGRSLIFNRNVGHLMDIDIFRDRLGNPVPEGIIDGVMTALIGMIDLQKEGVSSNTKKGSIYIVKPKMHGPEEVKFTCELFYHIEDMLGLEKNTIKLGIMDEERRTTVNLKECIRQAQHRLVFINTGFLDRTGDEIHTSMEAGPFLPKQQIKQQRWIKAYEDHNVDIGLACGLPGKAQIGKGMWTMPDQMAQMLDIKIEHPRSGANTAWVPSPTAAVLHALHYHRVDVFEIQKKIRHRNRASLEDILTIPLMTHPEDLQPAQIRKELENNIQGILGYVVRWVEQGIGCSKVPDINNIGLMEDRATLRISAKHVANWLRHGICTEKQVIETMRRMAAVVDTQNIGTAEYVNMSGRFETSYGFKAAHDLIFRSQELPNGYTEPLLHQYRITVKKIASS